MGENFVASIGNDILQIAGSMLALAQLRKSMGCPEGEQAHNFFKYLVLSHHYATGYGIE